MNILYISYINIFYIFLGTNLFKILHTMISTIISYKLLNYLYSTYISKNIWVFEQFIKNNIFMYIMYKSHLNRDAIQWNSAEFSFLIINFYEKNRMDSLLLYAYTIQSKIERKEERSYKSFRTNTFTSLLDFAFYRE